MASTRVKTNTETSVQTKIAIAFAAGGLLAASAGFVLSARPPEKRPPKPLGMSLGAWIPAGYVPAGYVPGGYVPGGYWYGNGSTPGYYYSGKSVPGHPAPSVRYEGRYEFLR